MNNIKMLYFDRSDISERIDVNKRSKECIKRVCLFVNIVIS